MSERKSARRSSELLDVEGAAAHLGTSERHIRRLVSERRIPYSKLGPGRSARLRFRVDQLEQWVDEYSFEPESGGSK